MKPTEIKVKVTTHDLKTGIVNNPFLCPIALSLKRMGFVHVEVRSCVAIFTNGSMDYRRTLPPIATKFVSAFDRGLKVSPMSFSV